MYGELYEAQGDQQGPEGLQADAVKQWKELRLV
jgi:hypothetical protein